MVYKGISREAKTEKKKKKLYPKLSREWGDEKKNKIEAKIY